jgi:hypothetical protein
MSAAPAEALRRALRGENAPVCAQLVYLLVHELEPAVAQQIGSRQFRAAARTYFDANGIPFIPTRSDLAEGARFLAKHGLLNQAAGDRESAAAA